MKERDNSKSLGNIIQLDGVFWSDERRGGKRERWAKDHLAAGSTVVSDGLACFFLYKGLFYAPEHCHRRRVRVREIRGYDISTGVCCCKDSAYANEAIKND